MDFIFPAGRTAMYHLPSYDAVVCWKSYEFNGQALMDAVWETIVAQW